MSAYVKTSIQDQVGTIEFFNPQSNSLPGDQLLELAAAIREADQHPDVRVIVLKSAGDRAFCAGASFDELVGIADEKTGLKFFTGFAEVINAMRKATKFVVVRVQGKAVGGGVGIAAAGDYTLATESAAIKLSELAVGIGPFVVGPSVERKMGLSAFSQLTINATEFRSAAWAASKGLYSEVYPDTEKMDQAIDALTKQLAQSSPEAMKAIKEIFWQGTEDWDQKLVERAKISGRLVLSAFTKDAISRFKAK